MDWVIRGEELVGRQGMQQLMNITRMVARRVVRIRHALERVQERAQAVAEAPPLGLPRRISQLMDLQGGSSGSR